MNKRTAAVALATTAAGVIAFAPAASAAPEAKSGAWRSASGGQCRAAWNAPTNAFHISDGDLNDSDWCYVQYGYATQNLRYRESIPQDRQGSFSRSADDVAGNKYVYWKVCKERQNDPDVCSGVYQSVV
jgi:hypothetical protein